MLPGLPSRHIQRRLQAATTFTPSDIVSGDFNNDGQLDLAAVDFFKIRFTSCATRAAAYSR